MSSGRIPITLDLFEDTGPNNPLRKFTDKGKHALIGLIYMYLVADESDELNEGMEILDEIGKLAAQASDLANRMRILIFDGQLPADGEEFSLLPPLLEAFASRTAGYVNQIGKPGHRVKLARNCFLVWVSEFVCAMTGRHYDEHLAEVIQAVSFRRNPIGEESELSGDAIRKIRKYVEERYPEMYRVYYEKGRAGADLVKELDQRSCLSEPGV